MLHQGLSAREIARRSAVIAEKNGNPELAVGHQAVSAWVNGTRHPNARHKGLLAAILGVSLANLTRACDAEDEHLNVHSTFRPRTAIVHGALHNYGHSVVVRTDINLSEPAIYCDWSDMFTFRPLHLMRHFRNVPAKLFGWIPDDSASPMVRSPHCLVPLERVSQRTALRILDMADSAHRRVWFVYLPGGKLHVGVGYRDGRYFSFARNNGGKVVFANFLLPQVDFVGYFTGKVLFHLLLASKNEQTRKHRESSNHILAIASLGNAANRTDFPLAELSR
jgi:transcriptional regulator with XRE-family HTH domain